MLQIKNLTITHKKDLRPLLEDFNFTQRKIYPAEADL